MYTKLFLQICLHFYRIRRRLAFVKFELDCKFLKLYKLYIYIYIYYIPRTDHTWPDAMWPREPTRSDRTWRHVAIWPWPDETSRSHQTWPDVTPRRDWPFLARDPTWCDVTTSLDLTRPDATRSRNLTTPDPTRHDTMRRLDLTRADPTRHDATSQAVQS